MTGVQTCALPISESLPITLVGKTFAEKISTLPKPILITNSEELTYLCNIRDFSKNYAVKVDGKLLILKEKSILFTESSFVSDEFEVMPLDKFMDIIKSVKDTVNVDKSTITAEDYSLIARVKNITSPVKMMKSVKNEVELQYLKNAFAMTDKALLATRDYIYNNDNLSEYDIDVELEKNFRKFGAKSLSFKSIVARNQNSALAHYMKSSKDEIVKDGDLILIDCGAYYEGGLATDITRVFVKGTPNDLQKKVYTTVLKMFLNAFNYQFVENKTCGFEIDRLAREVYSKNVIGD